jgi:Family of unknown function (DUF5989)
MPMHPMTSPNEFLAEAGHHRQRSLLAELVAFMRETRAWWMAPILVVLGLVGTMLVLGATGLAPFMYPFW